MWNDDSYLNKVYKLSRSGFFLDFYEGQSVARRYADIGFEEFMVLNNYELVSKLTGTKSSLVTDEKRELFLVPIFEEAVAWLEECGGNLSSLTKTGAKRWKAQVKYGDKILETEEKSPAECIVVIGTKILK
jgi:hypothetical protein